MDDKLDKIVESIHRIDKTLERNTTTLEHHVRRTDLLEAKVDPIVSHVTKVEFFFKAAKWVGLPLILTSLGILIKAYIN